MSNILTLPDMRRRRAPAAAPGRLVELFALHRHGPGDVRWLKENAEILRLLVDGHSAKEIARLLDISHRTVEYHKYQAMEALGVATNAELIQLALRLGIAGR